VNAHRSAHLRWQGTLDRYRQVLPKFIFSETEAVYAGTTFDLLPKVKEVAQDLSSKGLEHVILLPGIKTGREVSPEVVMTISLRSVVIDCCIRTHLKMSSLSKNLSAFLASDNGRPLMFEQLPFGHPLYILYSSGTTGPPKCIVHCAGVCERDLLHYSLSHATRRAPLFSQRKNSRSTSIWGLTIRISNILRYTCSLHLPRFLTHPPCFQTAWMMWPYMLAGLACGSRVILYDGSPFYPDVKAYLRFIDNQKYTASFTSSIASTYVGLAALPFTARAPASYLNFKDVEYSPNVSAYATLFPPSRRTTLQEMLADLRHCAD
jgi:acetoacetyl-CoA synthetase